MKESELQIGILRSIGMSKKDIVKVTLIEASTNIYSATIIGFVTGYTISLVAMSVLTTGWEFPVDYSVDWISFIALIGVSYIIVIFGTKICV